MLPYFRPRQKRFRAFFELEITRVMRFGERGKRHTTDVVPRALVVLSRITESNE